MKPKFIIIAGALFILCTGHFVISHAQGAPQEPIQNRDLTLADMNDQDVDAYINGVNGQVNALNGQLSKKTLKYLDKLSRHDRKILSKLSRIDSSAISNFGTGTKNKYDEFAQKLNTTDGKLNRLTKGQYLPMLDSMNSSLRFLKDAKSVLFRSREIKQKLDGSLEQFGTLKDNLNRAEDIQQYVQQRQSQLREILSKYPSLPGLKKSLDKYSESVYYYGQEIAEIKEAINDPGKLVRKGLALLNKVPAFQQFWSKHSILAALFPSPDNSSTTIGTGVPGLQSRADIQQILQRQFGPTTGSNPSQMVQQQIQQAQHELTKLKDKVNKIVNNGKGDINMPEFKPNSQKTKDFWKRIELGAGLQSQKANYFFPMRTDISLSAGYRISDSKVAGIALAGKIGWGTGWRQVKVTGEGVGLRTFLEWKVKGNFWLAGGAEMNYLKPIDSLRHLKNYENWTQSALIGISRSYRLSKKINGKMQVLYDFLHRQNRPATEPVVFRLGYMF